MPQKREKDTQEERGTAVRETGKTFEGDGVGEPARERKRTGME